MVVYEQLRERVFRKDSSKADVTSSVGAQQQQNWGIWQAMLCGVVGGAVAQLLASPADLPPVS